MKKTSSTLIIASLSLVVLLFLTSAVNPQESKKKYLTFRIMEFGSDPKMTIVYEDGKIEDFEINLGVAKNFSSNSLKINQILNMLSDKGYELVSSTGGENISNFTFIKK